MPRIYGLEVKLAGAAGAKYQHLSRLYEFRCCLEEIKPKKGTGPSWNFFQATENIVFNDFLLIALVFRSLVMKCRYDMHVTHKDVEIENKLYLFIKCRIFHLCEFCAKVSGCFFCTKFHGFMLCKRLKNIKDKDKVCSYLKSGAGRSRI